MNLLNKTFGASGVVTLDLTPAGLVLVVSDSEKLSDQSINETIKPDVLIDQINTWVGAPVWLAGVVTFLKAEIDSLAVPATPAAQ